MAKPFGVLQFTSASPFAVIHDLVWHAGWFACDSDNPRPNWSGYMHQVTFPPSGEYVPSADICMLPIIDLNPNNLSCIHSTLVFLEQQAK